MVQKDHSQDISSEPPQLGDSWWKAALSEGEEGIVEADFQEEFFTSPEDHNLTLVNLIQPENDWEYINRLYLEDEIIKLKVVGCNQGGLLVQGEKINGFIPSSHLLAGHKKKEYLQQFVSLKVIEYDKERCRVVLSERAAQAEPGTRIKFLTDFGAFVDLGGMEGLIHISELSWGRVDHPVDVVAIGDELEVYVLNIDRDENKVALSLKKMCPNPWETIADLYHQGQIVEAVVKNIVSYGAFVRLEEGVDGLIHISELGDNGDQVSPWDVLEENQKVSVEIIHLDPEEQRLGLSLEVGK
jgi:small subunit ribosomal protein S1